MLCISIRWQLLCQKSISLFHIFYNSALALQNLFLGLEISSLGLLIMGDSLCTLLMHEFYSLDYTLRFSGST
jgi:hypothetical protein